MMRKSGSFFSTFVIRSENSFSAKHEPKTMRKTLSEWKNVQFIEKGFQVRAA